MTTTDSVGIDAAAAGDSIAVVHWSAIDPQGQTLPVAIFGSTARNTVYSGAPLDATPSGGSTVLASLTNGQEFFIGIAIDEGGGAYSATGPILRVVPNAPIYVDAASTAVTPDGLTPATAFPTLSSGVAAALLAGGGNVWVAAGTYTNTHVSIPPDVHVYGGFESTFDISLRDPAAHVTRLQAMGTNTVLEVTGGQPEAIVDGLTVDGLSTANFGIDVSASDCLIRDVLVESCADCGVRASSTSTTIAYTLTAIRLASVENTNQGLSLSGGFNVTLDGCRFSNNSERGADLNALVALDDVPVRLAVRNSRFFGNGFNGMNARLAAPAGGGANGSSFDVSVSGSTFEQNGTFGTTTSASGLLLDVDYETAVGWTSKIVVSGCRARANETDGVALDLDSNARTFVQRLSSAANGGDGVLVSSSAIDGVCTITSSALTGNMGFGARATSGDVALLVAHSVVSGNDLGGIASDTVESSASSSIAWLQGTPFALTREHFDHIETIVANLPFFNAPIGFYTVSAVSSGQLTLDTTTGLAAADNVEVSDDGTVRTISTVGASTVTVTPAPTGLALPSTLFDFGTSSDPVEDWLLAPGSTAEDTGMPPAGGGTVDSGPFAAPHGGAPGVEDLIPPVFFFASDVSPSVATGVAATDTILISFTNGIPALATVDATTVQVRDSAGNILAPTLSVSSARINIAPPGGTWPSGDLTVELHVGLMATNGRPLAVPVAIPLHVP